MGLQRSKEESEDRASLSSSFQFAKKKAAMLVVGTRSGSSLTLCWSMCPRIIEEFGLKGPLASYVFQAPACIFCFPKFDDIHRLGKDGSI